ncbi:MAG: hypothetical protein AB7O91_07350, partial [Sphingomonas sp.]
EGEDIIVHRVKLAEITAFVAAKRAEEVAIDVKLLMLLAADLMLDSGTSAFDLLRTFFCGAKFGRCSRMITLMGQGRLRRRRGTT